MAVSSPARAARPPAVARVLERVTATVRRHRLLRPGQKVLLAVSGGPDSLCLLHVMVRLRRLLRVRLAVLHVDHGMREGSAADARYVTAAANRLGVTAYVDQLQGREAWLRSERYRSFEDVRVEARADAVATAHTADDHAETVLMALVRGGGLEALTGIPVRRDRIIRPLLEVTRAETEAFCRALHLRPRQDPMNRDRRYLRNAVRLGAIPLLERATGRDVKATIARTAAALREDARFLEAAAEEAAAGVVSELDGDVVLDARRLRALPYPLASRVVARTLRAEGVPADLARAHVDALLDLAGGRPGRRVDLPRGLSARRESSYVRLARPSPASPPSPLPGGARRTRRRTS